MNRMMGNAKARQLLMSCGVLALCAGVAFALSRWSKPLEKKQAVIMSPLVEYRIMELESVRFKLPSQGVVRPSTVTALVVEVAGVVTEVSSFFVSGGLFQKGDVLARLDDNDYRVSMQQAEASLAAAQARLQEEQARSEAEQKNWLRSGRQLADAPALLLRTPYVNEAMANVKAADAQLEQAQRKLAKTVIRAPYDGMVRERDLNIGQYLSPGSAVGTVFDVSDVEVRLPIKPADLSLIDLPPAGHVVDSDIQVQLKQTLGRQEVTWDARLARVEGVVDEQSRMHYVVAKVDDPFGLAKTTQSKKISPFALKPGSFVTAELSGAAVNDVFSLPRSALYGSGQVLVVTEQNSLRFRRVTRLHADESRVYISSGLEAGDRVCLTVLANPMEGMQVRLTSSGAVTGDRADPVTTR